MSRPSYRCSRRTFGRSGAVCGVIGLSGCTGWFEQPPDDLAPGADWPSFQRTPANRGYNPDARALGDEVEVVWEHSIQGSARIQPTITDGMIYAGGGSIDRSSELRAIDLDSGTQAWSVETETGIRSAPAVTDEGIVVGLDDDLVALDTDGDERWRFPTSDKIQSDPTIVDGIAYVGSDDGCLYAVDVATGDEEWRFESGDRILASPSVANGQLIVGSIDGYSYALSAATGDVQWKREIGNWVRATAAIVDGVVYTGGVVSPAEEANLYAIEAETGEIQWQVPVEGGVRRSVAVDDDTVVCTNGYRSISGISRSAGTERWRYDLDARTAPTIGDGVTYVGNINDGSVYALDLETGDVRWRFEVGLQMSGGLVPLENTVFVAGWDATVYALRGAN